jgi:hypothetical protein
MENSVICNYDETLLNVDNLDKIIFGPSPLMNGKLVSEVVKKYMFIQEGCLFILRKNFIYVEISKAEIDSVIWQNTSQLLDSSFAALSEIEQMKIKSQMKDRKISLSKVFSKADIMKYIDVIKTNITLNDVKLNDYTGMIHFRNGYIDIKQNKFLKRDSSHYITKYIDREYIPSTLNKRNEIKYKYLKPIYNQEDDLNCILNIMGSAVTGLSNRDQDMLFLIGEGSSGKTTIFSLIKEAFTSTYFKELKPDLFSTSNSERNKLANSFIDDKQVLFILVNELTGDRIDGSYFKTFVEGNVNTTKLYTEGSHNVKIKAKTFATSNEFPNLKLDTGSLRRLTTYTHK